MTEEKIKESEEKYRQIIKHLDQGYFKTDINGIILEHNPAVNKILGFELDESLVGLSAKDFFGSIEEFKEYQKEITKKGRLSSFIHSARNKNGETIFLHTHSHVYKNKEKNRFEVEGTVFDITEKFILEKKLKGSEEKYRNLFERAPFSIWLIDFDGTIIDCNVASNSLISKIDVKNLIGKNLTDLSVLVKKFKKSLDFSKELISESIISRLRGRMQNVIKGEVQEPIEFQYHRFDGKSLWVNLQSSLVKTEDKELIQVIIQDITERKKIEKELEESEKKYRNLIENTKDAIVIVGLDGKYKYISPQFSTMLGERKINLEDDIFSLIHPDDKPQLIDLFSQAVKQKSILNIEVEFRILHKEGHYIWVLTSTQDYYDDEGNMEGFITDLRDVTARKVAEQKLKESEQKYRNIIENSKDAIVIIGLDAKFKYISPQLSKIVGKEYNVETKLLTDVHPDDLDYLKDILSNALKNRDVGAFGDFEFRALHHDGYYISFSCSAKNYYDNDGNVIGFIILLRDVTDKKEAEQKLKESEEKHRGILDKLEQGYYEVDLKGNYTFVNKFHANYFGYSKDEFIGKSYRNFFDVETGKRIFKTYNEIYRKSLQKGIIELKTVRPDGVHHIFEASIYLKRDSNGKKIGFYGTTYDISERKKWEQQIQESEERYRLITENANDMIVVLNDKFEYEYINEKVHMEIMGFSKKDIIGKSALDFIHPNDIEKAVNYLKDGFKTGEGGGEVRVRRKKGDYLLLEVRGKIFTDKEGNRKGLLISRDITKRKIAEQKLRESEEKYHDLFNSTPYAIWLVDLNGVLIDCNTTMNKFMTVFKKEDLIGKSFSEIIGLFLSKGDSKFENLSSVFKEGFKLLLKQGYVDPFEFQITRADGKELWITLESSVVLVGNEKFVQIFIKDITERKEADLKVKESEEKYRLISENANDLILILDKEGNFLYCNETFKKVIGYSPEELLGTNAVKLVHPDDLNQVRRDFQYTLEAGSGMNIGRFRCKDGTYKWIESKGNITYDEDNNPTKNFIVARDISERKNMEEKLKKSEEGLKKLNIELEKKVRERTKELEEKNIELKKLDQAKDDFITMAAHELKTPLISVAGYTDYILTKYIDDLTVDVKNDLLIVQRNIDRLQTLMNQLLDVMKIESHKMNLNVERINISNIIYRCLHELNYLFKEKDHEMVLNIDNEIFINIDPSRMFQVFSNLISNSTKFTPKGGKIEISAKKDVMHYLFEVKDNGIGLPEEDLDRIFKKFETVKNDDESFQTGSGLGLYISKGFVEAHGGQMWATSEGLNKGMTIHFTIPT